MIHNWMEWSVSEKSGTLESRQSVAKKREREENATQAKGKAWRTSKKERKTPRKLRAKRGEKARKSGIDHASKGQSVAKKRERVI